MTKSKSFLTIAVLLIFVSVFGAWTVAHDAEPRCADAAVPFAGGQEAEDVAQEEFDWEEHSLQMLDSVDPSTLFGGGSGTAEDPFLISNQSQLDSMRSWASEGEDDYEEELVIYGNFKLTDDIFVSSTFTPLPYFCGTLNGNGKTIAFNSLGTDDLGRSGLFSTMVKGMIKDLTVYVLGESDEATYRGAICGVVDHGQIINCEAKGQFANLNCNSLDSYSGGICGENLKGYIENCTSSLNITTYGNAGGLVGYLYQGHIENSRFSGQIKFDYQVGSINNEGNNQSYGGICGYAFFGTIDSCIVKNDHRISYIGPGNNNAHFKPNVGYAIGKNKQATYSIAVEPSAVNDKGNLRNNIFSGNQAQYFKSEIDANCLVGRQV